MAKKHPSSSRVHRDEGVPDDAFVGTIRRITEFVQENRQATVVGIVAILLVAGGTAWFISQQRTLESTAESRFLQVQQSVVSGNTQLAIRDLQSFLETFGSTEIADQARLSLADLLLADGQPEQAIAALGDMPDRINEPFGLAAARLEGSALERLERYPEAVQAYLDIADHARFDYQRRQALADAGRVEIQHGDPEAAVAHFDRLLQTFEPGEAGRGYFEIWLAEAQARARTGQGTTSVPPVGIPADTAATG